MESLEHNGFNRSYNLYGLNLNTKFQVTMSMPKSKFSTVITSAVTSLVVLLLAYPLLRTPAEANLEQDPRITHWASYSESSRSALAEPVHFEEAAALSIPAVVHVRTLSSAKSVVAEDPLASRLFGPLFGQRQYYIPPQRGSGSGVVFDPKGYIVTNYHVIAGAEKVSVTFNDRYTAEARVVASDPATDISVLKVDESKPLPYLRFGNSDEVRLGQWVLAVGYPLSLDATVTAGIVSAKGRALGINQTQSLSAIESFIQTDAAVNPGNSGGALVNTAGELIGINSAIASPTGSYAGYSYAIPSNMVQKVVNDLVAYGSVQRAYLGVQYPNRKRMSAEAIKELGLDKVEGVYIDRVIPNSGADQAGLKKGDFILSINGHPTRTETQLVEQMARYQPGDHIEIQYLRHGKTYKTQVELRNIENSTEIIRRGEDYDLLGAKIRRLGAEELSKHGLSHGFMVSDPGNGLLAELTQIQPGYIITHVNDIPIKSIEDLSLLLKTGKKLQFSGKYPGKPGVYYYMYNPS